MRWSKRDVIYQVFVDRFSPVDAQKAKKPVFAGGNLRGITEKINYFKDLGVTAIWLTPIYEGTEYHGYHITDFIKINSHFGTTEDLKILINTFHKQNIKIMLDFVPNHISATHPFFQEALHKKTKSFREWFYIDSKNNYVSFFNIKETPKLNLDNKITRLYIIDAAKYWLSIGVDGLRLDHAIGPSIDFWKEFSKNIKKQFPSCFLLGEVWADNLSWKDLKTTKAKNKCFKWLFQKGNDSYMEDYQEVFDGCLDFTFNKLLRNYFFEHEDKELFAKKIAKHYSKFNKKLFLPTFLDNHDMNRFYFSCNNKEEYKKAINIQFAQQQPTIIYYGNESGMSQEKKIEDIPEYGDVQVRQPMNWENIDGEIVEYYKKKIKIKTRK